MPSCSGVTGLPGFRLVFHGTGCPARGANPARPLPLQTATPSAGSARWVVSLMCRGFRGERRVLILGLPCAPRTSLGLKGASECVTCCQVRTETST